MIVFDSFKQMKRDQLAEWLDSLELSDAPWHIWFSESYCKNCEPILRYVPYIEKEAECSYCEVNGCCQFFLDFERDLSTLDIINLWLESEGELNVTEIKHNN